MTLYSPLVELMQSKHTIKDDVPNSLTASPRKLGLITTADDKTTFSAPLVSIPSISCNEDTPPPANKGVLHSVEIVFSLECFIIQI